MKKIATLFCFYLLLSFICRAQSVRLSIEGGYNAPIAADMMQVNANQVEVSGYPGAYATTSATLVRRSYGQGGCIGLGVQWFSKKGIGLGLRLTADIIGPQYSNLIFTDTSNTNHSLSFTDRGFSFQFVPHIAFRHDFRRVSPVLELGMIAGINNITQTYVEDNFITSAINQHGGVMLGFYSSLGLNFHISRVVDFTLAVHCNAASYTPLEWTRTSFIEGGVNYVGQLPSADTQGTYSKNYQAGSSQDSRFTVPFSNVGFTAGFAFNIGKKKLNHNLEEKKGDAVHPAY